MAGVRHKDVAKVLSDVANVFVGDTNPFISLTGLKVAIILTDWLEDQPESLQKMYDSMLNVEGGE